MPHISPLELIIIALVMFLFFGANRLPDAARSIGQSFKIFKKEMNDVKEATNLTPQVEAKVSEETK